MHINTQMIIQRNPLLKRYLREHSYYYKYLNREYSSINQLQSEMQKAYKMTIPDKLDKIKENLDTINSFMDIMK